MVGIIRIGWEMIYRIYFKRLFDVIISLISLILFSPIILTIAFVLFVVNRGDVFFFQMRPGLNQKLFRIIKFKTMTNKRDSFGKLLPDAERLTNIGKMLRNISLDELPQLVNVLKGDMSVVGPRPLLVEYLDLYSGEQKRRHFVRPGLTGLAQINGRNSISWSSKFQYDVDYVDSVSFCLDLKIIFKSMYKVLVREGISQRHDGTVDPFNGFN
ncbi:sugar transferase [Lunatimonas salinarum]|uniref:sugar transferase n=1 Tax=Lunatimonas salinarum TaxID=1774590 RepID=UPI0031594CD4